MTSPAALPYVEHRHLCGDPADVAAEIEELVLAGWSFIDVPHDAPAGRWCIEAHLPPGAQPLRVVQSA